MNAPSRPVLRWHGGKWRIAPWIIGFMPTHKIYVEPYCGAASVLLRKPRSITEIVNDVDDDIVNLFRVLREQPDEIARALALTPFARAEYNELYKPASDPIERARRFISRSFFGISSQGAMRKSGFDTRMNGDSFVGRLRSFTILPDVAAEVAGRLTHVIIEHDTAQRVIARSDRPETLFYVDPPYLPETRTDRRYTHEMERDDHVALLDQLKGLRGMVMLSGYPSKLYDQSLKKWRRVRCDAYTDGAKKREEVLWINPAAVVAIERERAQMRLFDEVQQ